VSRFHIIKVIKAVKVMPYVMMRITILPLSKYQKKYRRNLYLKILVDNVISKGINMLKIFYIKNIEF
jgi:hypothetical protein